jgi:thiamine-phosphate pyrophosphorylase
MVKPLRSCRLYTFVDLAYVPGQSVADVAKQLCDGGSDLIQLRAKGYSSEEIERLAETLMPIISKAGSHLVINDHVDVAHSMGAPLAHLGQEDFFGRGKKQISEIIAPGSHLQVGLSSHAPDQALRAVEAGAAYVAVGPVYPTPTKPNAPAVTLEYVRWAAAHLQVPWFAIGGINLFNLEDVLAAGARRVCVVSAILNAANIARACQEFKKRITSVPL